MGCNLGFSRESKHVGATVSFDALRYPYYFLCNFQTSFSHNSDTSGGSANRSWSRSACRTAVCINCNCDVAIFRRIVSVLYDIRTTSSAISKLRFHTTLTLLVALQTGLGQCRHAGLLCASIATAMLPFSEGLFRCFTISVLRLVQFPNFVFTQL